MDPSIATARAAKPAQLIAVATNIAPAVTSTAVASDTPETKQQQQPASRPLRRIIRPAARGTSKLKEVLEAYMQNCRRVSAADSRLRVIAEEMLREERIANLTVQVELYQQIGQLHQDIEALQEEGHCILCHENSRTVRYDPCGHVICCDVCTTKLVTAICPICRTPIASAQQIYF